MDYCLNAARTSSLKPMEPEDPRYGLLIQLAAARVALETASEICPDSELADWIGKLAGEVHRVENTIRKAPAGV